MKIVYLYDVEGWALHNVGLLLQPHFQQRGHEFELLATVDYSRRPFQTDVLYLGYSGLYEPALRYRRYAHEVICTVHDPIEISNFTDRFDWQREPLRHVPLAKFDRVSTGSLEIYALLRERFRHPQAFHTPTYPHDADDIRRVGASRRRAGDVVLFSATNAEPRYRWSRVARRLLDPGDYLFDHTGAASLRQLRSLLIRVNRKNIPLLERLRSALSSRRGVRVNFLHSRSTIGPRDAYIAQLTAADVYVCTSFMEGGPLPVMEAVLGGLAVLSTPVGQVSEWVRHDENGFICRRFEDFIAGIDAYLTGPTLRRHQAESLRRGREKTFDPQPWFDFVLARSAKHPGADARG